jgi:hypothetical protein
MDEFEPEPEPAPEPQVDTEVTEFASQMDDVVSQSSEETPKSTEENVTPQAKTLTVKEYKTLLDELEISYEGLKGSRAFKERYQKHLSDLTSQTEDMSSEEELEEDKYEEIYYEGQTYLESEDTGGIFTTEHTKIAESVDDLYADKFVSEDAYQLHQTNKD